LKRHIKIHSRTKERGRSHDSLFKKNETGTRICPTIILWSPHLSELLQKQLYSLSGSGFVHLPGQGISTECHGQGLVEDSLAALIQHFNPNQFCYRTIFFNVMATILLLRERSKKRYYRQTAGDSLQKRPAKASLTI